MLLGVVGLSGSGKDTVAQYLVEHYNFVHKDLGQEIRNELKRLGKNFLDRSEMILLANEYRQKFGFNYWCKKTVESVNSKDLIITSIRNPSEVDEINARGGTIVGLFADQKVRFERTVARVKENSSAHGDVLSFEDFKTKEKRELENTDPAKQQLLKCISMVEYKLDNNGSIEQLEAEIEALLEKLSGKLRL
jgi:dephospho-CoA kinase